ncbi:hypothetical protein CASFOL_004457 [Castilleja foliolosa]|uniref:Uncharacterized protein n=1 Tax=Castilleja foliolosa TaxID=1961234 RepID=A0ABD3EAJ2_9LAMI
MSNKHRPKADDGGGGGAGDEEGNGPTNPKEKKCPGCGKKARRFSFIRLRKKKQIGVNVNPGCWGRKLIGCACLKQPRTLDSSGESPESDPNSREFTFDMFSISNFAKKCSSDLWNDDLSFQVAECEKRRIKRQATASLLAKMVARVEILKLILKPKLWVRFLTGE